MSAESIEKRIAELKHERDVFAQEAMEQVNRRLAEFKGAIDELDAWVQKLKSDSDQGDS